MQKLSAKLSTGCPRRPSPSPPLISAPDYMYRIFSVQEVTVLLNLPQAAKVFNLLLLHQTTVIWKLKYFTVICNIMRLKQ